MRYVVILFCAVFLTSCSYSEYTEKADKIIEQFHNYIRSNQPEKSLNLFIPAFQQPENKTKLLNFVNSYSRVILSTTNRSRIGYGQSASTETGVEVEITFNGKLEKASVKEVYVFQLVKGEFYIKSYNINVDDVAIFNKYILRPA